MPESDAEADDANALTHETREKAASDLLTTDCAATVFSFRSIITHNIYVDMLLCCEQTALTPRLGLLVECISELETTDKSDAADRSSGQSEHVVVGSSMTR